jgi:hypothetical protein
MITVKQIGNIITHRFLFIEDQSGIWWLTTNGNFLYRVNY